jgi:hypothetical protein
MVRGATIMKYWRRTARSKAGGGMENGMLRTRIAFYATAALVPLAFPCAPARAAWDTVGQIVMTIEGDDNPRLTAIEDQQVSDSRTVLNANVRASSFGERGNFWVEPRIQARAYSDSTNADLEKEDVYLRSEADYSWPNVEVGYRADLSRRSIRNAELPAAAPTDPDFTDLGDLGTGDVALLTQYVNRKLFDPTIDFRFSERTSIVLETQFTDVSYSGPGTAERTDFTDKRLSIGLDRRVSERNRVSASFFASTFEAVGNANKTDTVGVQANLSRPLSETLTFNLSVGLERSEYTFVQAANAVDNADSSYTLNVGLRKRAQRTTLNFDIGRQLFPNGIGFLTNTDQVRLFVSRQFSERFSGRVGVRAFSIRTLGNVAAANERDYSRLELELQWGLTPRWGFRAGYTYSNRKYTNRGEPAASSRVLYVGIGYAGLSRQGR